MPSWRGARSSSAKAKGLPKVCVSRIARVFDRRVVQSILRKPVTARRTCAFSSRRVLIAATRLSLDVRSRSASIRVWKQRWPSGRRGASRFYDEWMAEQRLRSVNVECYAGHRGEQTPRTLIIGDRRIAVAEVLDAWLAPEYRYFKLRGADGDTYVVRHDERTGIWELTMFRAERFRPAP